MIHLAKKSFEISHITNDEELNSLSLTLNEQEQVSHIKVSENTIVFYCIDIEPLLKIINAVNKDLIVKEIVDGKKRQYDFANREKRKHYFMFKNVLTEEDLFLLEERIQNDRRVQDVHYDPQNKILTLLSNYRDALSVVQKELFKINPSIEVVEHRRPIRSEDVFQQKYIGNYIRIGGILVLGAISILVGRNHNQFTSLLWLVTLLLLSENLLKKVWSELKQLKFFNQEVLTLVAMVLGIFSGAYVETCLAVILYQCSVIFYTKSLETCLNRIDETMKIPETGKRFKDNQEECISLYDFEVGDQLIIAPGETITIPGIVKKGHSQLSTYTNTSTYDLKDATEGTRVYSGDYNAGKESLYIEVTSPYESSNLLELMQIASVAPVYESKIEKITKKFVKIYTPVMVILALFIAFVYPITNEALLMNCLHVGAILLLIGGSLFSDQTTSLGMLAGFAKAFQEGIVVESSLGLDSLNATQTIVYDRFDGVEVNEEELELFKKLSHLGKNLVIFNDGPVALENDQYKIFNDVSNEEKLKIMDECVQPVVYIGDSFKDISLLQKSYVGVSRGGLSDAKVVESSDIVLIDANMNKVYDTFMIARKIRTHAILNHMIAIFVKLAILVLALGLTAIPLWLIVLIEILMGMLMTKVTTLVLR